MAKTVFSTELISIPEGLSADFRLRTANKLVKTSSAEMMKMFLPFTGRVPEDSWFSGVFDTISSDTEVNTYRHLVSSNL